MFIKLQAVKQKDSRTLEKWKGSVSLRRNYLKFLLSRFFAAPVHWGLDEPVHPNYE
jgi:hypothetical protein